MTYHVLTPEEWPRLTELFLREFGHEPPSPMEAAFAVGEENGEIVSCLSLQMLPTIQSCWLHPKLRKSLAGASALKMLLYYLAWYFPQVSNVFIKDNSVPQMLKVAEYFGCKRECGLLKGETDGFRRR